MAEYTQAAATAIPAGQNIPFNETAVRGKACIQHREGAGIVTLRGLTNQCSAMYLVNFSGNIAVPTGGTVGPISVAIAVDGEPLASATGIVTPAAVEEFFNVAVAAMVCVPRGCCVTVAIENTSGIEITAQNSNLLVTRTA